MAWDLLAWLDSVGDRRPELEDRPEPDLAGPTASALDGREEGEARARRPGRVRWLVVLDHHPAGTGIAAGPPKVAPVQDARAHIAQPSWSAFSPSGARSLTWAALTRLR